MPQKTPKGKTTKKPTAKKSKAASKTKKKAPAMRKGTVLGYVKYDETGWWPDLEWDPKAFLPVRR